ncbi:TIGR03769 domain-containing protein [Nocardiopsis protaetiae]|uniref:TIGR03769 domain-containing protein n=1 Tax=Nocardiopsis protaetiae TaxID=3382270 RepID=UPI00387B687E
MHHDPDDVIVHDRAARRSTVSRYNQDWIDEPGTPYYTDRQYNDVTRDRPSVGRDATGLGADEVAGDPTWTLTGVRGPGPFAVYDNAQDRTVLGDWTREPADGHVLWTGTASQSPTWMFTEPGVYCLGFRWDAVLADGTPVAAETELTYVLDHGEAVTDVDAVEPCGAGGDPDPSPDPSGPPSDLGDPGDTGDPGTGGGPGGDGAAGGDAADRGTGGGADRSGTASSGGKPLPFTGPALLWLVAAGILTAAVGAGLGFAAGRRPDTETEGP